MHLSTLKIKPPKIIVPPVVYISVISLFGTLVGLGLSNFALNYVTGTSIAISIGMFGFCVKNKKIKLTMLLAATCSLFVARAMFSARSNSPPWVVINNGDLVELHGSVVSTPITIPRTQGYLSDIDTRSPVTTFNFLAAPQRGLAHKAIITTKVDGIPQINKGDQITAIGKLRRHLHTNNAAPTLFVPQETLIKVIHKNIKIATELEETVKQRIRNGIHGEEKTLVSALFFGEREAGWRKISSDFRQAGLSHILAVSGLHIAIIMILIIWAARTGSFGRLISFIIICAVSIFLLLIIESRPPVYRAVLMILIASTLQLRGQRFVGSGILAVVATIIAWSEPSAIKTAGFILSFTAVLGLCVLLPTLQWKLLGPKNNYATLLETTRYTISSLWIVGLCAVLIVTPLTMYMFGTAAPIGLFSSIGGILFLFFILLLGLIRLAIGWVHPIIDDQLLWCMKITSIQMVESTKLYGDIPLFFFIKPPSLILVILLIIFLTFIVLTMGRIKLKIITGALLFVWMLGNEQNNRIVITTLNVGHGTSHIIQDKQTTILVDAGSRANLDIGLHKILPALRKRGINKINTLVVTHNDLDHCSAILDLMHKLEIDEICMTPHALTHQTMVVHKIIQIAKHKKIRVNKITSGWSFDTKNAKITALWPNKDAQHESSNEASVVLSIQSNGRSVLLTGDINEKTISTFLTRELDKIDVLEMPHHGQWSRESVSFLNKLQPLVAIQSTSKSRFAHDKWVIPTTTDRFVTCVDGDITTTIGRFGELEVHTSYTNIRLLAQR